MHGRFFRWGVGMGIFQQNCVRIKGEPPAGLPFTARRGNLAGDPWAPKVYI
jgi:hypothetical protein